MGITADHISGASEEELDRKRFAHLREAFMGKKPAPEPQTQSAPPKKAEDVWQIIAAAEMAERDKPRGKGR